MNALPSYQTQYNKIIEAYFKDEIKPMDANFCFCGTLADNSDKWCRNTYEKYHNDYKNYTGVEYVKMERALLDSISEHNTDGLGGYDDASPTYENALFIGMAAALEVLKQIHMERGEIIEEVQPAFTKRNLAATN